MRYAYAEPLDREVSVVGFGCASLGSRVSPADGLRLLGAAHEQGVTWFDVAPAYGDGNAEAILGSFLGPRRDKVVVCTKLGLAPSRAGRLLGWIKPAARSAMNAAPGLRSALRAARPANAKMAITPALIEQSVSQSLRRLGTDYIDVIALHDATPTECANEEVIATLSRIVESGRARAVSIASRADSVVAGAVAWEGYSIAQISGSALSGDLRQLNSDLSRPLFRVVHGIFGVDGPLAALKARIKDPSVKRNLASLGYSGGSLEEIAASALMDYALWANRDGVVLCSMFSADHLSANCARASRYPSSEKAMALAALLGVAT